jgi:hypothetical protein
MSLFKLQSTVYDCFKESLVEFQIILHLISGSPESEMKNLNW